MKEKISSLKELKKISIQLKKKRKKIVFTNGCFDLLHYGHARYLTEAKTKGDILIVGVNSDSSVKKIKGNNRPLINQRDRINLIASLESVDYAFLFNGETPLKAIKAIKPDILIKGADWKKREIAGASVVSGYKGKVLTIRLLKGRSTTNLIRKIVSAH